MSHCTSSQRGIIRGNRNIFKGGLEVLKDKEVQLGHVSNMLMDFGVNQVDEQGVREQDS